MIYLPERRGITASSAIHGYGKIRRALHSPTPILRSASTKLATTHSIFSSLLTSLSFHRRFYSLLRSIAYANKNSNDFDTRCRARRGQLDASLHFRRKGALTTRERERLRSDRRAISFCLRPRCKLAKSPQGFIANRPHSTAQIYLGSGIAQMFSQLSRLKHLSHALAHGLRYQVNNVVHSGNLDAVKTNEIIWVLDHGS